MGIKRLRSGRENTIVDVWQREVGQLSSRNFAHRLVASEDLVLKLDIARKLEKHRGCVNTISFNASGEILVSGSDDRRVILWDWEAGRAKLSFHSGHADNIFQAKFMPYNDDRSLVTCGADGEVRHAHISEGGRVETFLLGTHDWRAHKLAIEPGSPYIFYSSGEDGLVQHFDLRTKAATELFKCRSTLDSTSDRSIVQLNAIVIDPRSPNLLAVGGSDEYARIYDIRRYKGHGSTDLDQPVNYYCPEHLVNDGSVGITGLAFSDQSELLVSYNADHIYLFAKDMGLGPNPVPSSSLSTHSDADEPERDVSIGAARSVPQVYKGHCNYVTIKGVSFFGPKSEYVMSGSDCGRIFIWRKKGGELIRVMEADRDVVNCIESHPHAAVLASSGIDTDIKIWTPKAEERATLPTNITKSRPRHGRWMHDTGSPRELLMELFTRESHISSREHNRDDTGSREDLLQLLMSLGRDTDNSSHDGGDDDESDPEDFQS
ncbi:uncharacterized protein LOC130805157 [Amaranthus tricolor]|uniref:uncharacterized protein LOC130805157 n=1 Tax=Amaranthus tricolor TaxID=29722 RepID=UPI00258A6F03|nr:uncharacterized protein LOC130805157 [Amaranthus tricolor]